MSTSVPFRVESGEGFTPSQLVEVLGTAYGTPFTEEWFTWKHREAPWGPSRCWVAVDEGGILGLMFGLPWPYRSGAIKVAGARLVDGGSTPRARGRGVFREVVARELAEWAPTANPGLLVATATPEAAGAHVKNGALALDPVDYAYGPPPTVTRARLVTDASVLTSYASDGRTALHTDWDELSLRWRTDARSGYHYEVAALDQADGPHGVVYRLTTVKGVRAVVVVLTWGADPEVRRLLGAVSRHTRAPALLAPAGPGAAPRPWPAWIRRGTALLCVWPRVTSSLARQASTRDGWSLAEADVEGVI